jgi:hypothetical protein
MATVQLDRPSASVIQPRQAGLVYTRRLWTLDWDQQPYLYAREALLAAAPTISKATLVYHFGQMMQADKANFSQESPPDVDGHFVRLAVGTPFGPLPRELPWHGIIVAHEINSIGPFQDGVSSVAQGDILYTAYGLEYLLETVRISTAWAQQAAALVHLGHCPVFNERYDKGGFVLGNRTTAVTADGVHAFSVDNAIWTNLDILDYLLAYHAPDLGLDPSWVLEGEFAMLAQITEVHDLEGLTLRQALNKLIDRRRGLLWSIRTAGDGVAIHIASVFDTAVVAGGVTLSPNPEVAPLSLHVEGGATGPLVGAVQLGQTDAQRYGRIEVLGERARSCFTLGLSIGSLEATWAGAFATDYLAALGDDPVANDKYRARAAFDDVFCGFRVPTAWTMLGPTGEKFIPKLNDDGTLDPATLGPFLRAGHTFLPTLPLLDPVSDDEQSYQRPFAIASDPESGRLVPLHKHGVLGVPPVGLELHDRDLRIRLKAPHNHVMARGLWAGSPGPTMQFLGLADAGDYFDAQTLRVTVAIELDERLRIVQTISDADPLRTLTLYVPRAHLWYVAPSTIKGLDDDGTPLFHPGGVVRDDHARLEAVAALAKAWYGRTRQTLRYTIAAIMPLAKPGVMISAVEQATTEDPINTIVTSIHWNFEEGSTTLETGFWDLDFSANRFDIPGKPDAASLARQVDAQAAALAKETEWSS